MFLLFVTSVIVILAFVSRVSWGQSSTTSFSYTGSSQQWSVPSGVNVVRVQLWGGGGGGGKSQLECPCYSFAGGAGGYSQCFLIVTQSQSGINHQDVLEQNVLFWFLFLSNSFLVS